MVGRSVRDESSRSKSCSLAAGAGRGGAEEWQASGHTEPHMGLGEKAGLHPKSSEKS